MIRFRTNVTGHRVAVVWSGPESSRLGRLTLLQAAGIELSALSEADALGEAPKKLDPPPEKEGPLERMTRVLAENWPNP